MFIEQVSSILYPIEQSVAKPGVSAWIRKDTDTSEHVSALVTEKEPESPVKRAPMPENNPLSLGEDSDSRYSRYAGDIAALCDWMGGHLERGMTIDIRLKDLLDICPRNRRRIESYQGLKNWLMDDMEVILQISSNKTKSNKDNI